MRQNCDRNGGPVSVVFHRASVGFAVSVSGPRKPPKVATNGLREADDDNDGDWKVPKRYSGRRSSLNIFSVIPWRHGHGLTARSWATRAPQVDPGRAPRAPRAAPRAALLMAACPGSCPRSRPGRHSRFQDGSRWRQDGSNESLVLRS